MSKVVIMPPINPRYKNKVYSVEINGVEERRVIGVDRAMRISKYYKYSNCGCVVDLINITSGKLVYRF